jgi:tetratricopeptide (TPR) repeat protein
MNDESAKALVAKSYQRLGKEAEQKNELERAIEYYELAKLYRPKTPARPAPKKRKSTAIAKPTAPPVVKEADKKLAELKQKQADEFYQKGLRAFRNDIELAISYWEKALELDPGHASAKLKLNKAIQIRKNLRQIVDSQS